MVNHAATRGSLDCWTDAYRRSNLDVPRPHAPPTQMSTFEVHMPHLLTERICALGEHLGVTTEKQCEAVLPLKQPDTGLQNAAIWCWLSADANPEMEYAQCHPCWCVPSPPGLG